MGRIKHATALSLILVSMAFSGCIASDENSADSQAGNQMDEDFQGLDYIECMTHEELERCWNVLVPSSVDLSNEVPMIIDLHGATLTMGEQREVSQFDDIAEENGVIAVWPQGFDNYWNVSGECCGTAWELQLNDTGFLLDMIDTIVQNHSIDEDRIYLTGWSNGCAMSQKLANKHSELSLIHISEPTRPY